MLEDRPKSVGERQEELIALVWPEGMPIRDRIVMEAVPAAVRNQLLNRLEAVWRAEQGEPPGALANLAGLKRAAFYNLRVAWRKNSLAGLVPHDTRSGRRIDADKDDPLRSQAVALLRASPLRRNVDLAKSIMDANRSLVPEDAGPNYALTVLQRLQRLVGEERRRLAADPAFVGTAYGGELVLDLTAVQIIIESSGRSLAIAAILLETASGLVLGSALGEMHQGTSLQCDALKSGLSFLESQKADIADSSDAMPRLGWMLPPGVDAEQIAGSVEPHVGELIMGRAGGFSFGQQVLQVVGPRIGRTPLNPRRTLLANVDMEEYPKRRVAPVLTLDEARAIWAREVERHNADRVDALTKAGIIGRGVPHGRLAAVIRAMLVALQPS